MDGLAVARQMLKVAAAHGTSRTLGKVLRTGFSGAGDIGAGLVEGLGGSAGAQTAGRLAGMGGAGYAGYRGAQKAKQEVDEFRYRHGLYRDPTY